VRVASTHSRCALPRATEPEFFLARTARGAEKKPVARIPSHGKILRRANGGAHPTRHVHAKVAVMQLIDEIPDTESLAPGELTSPLEPELADVSVSHGDYDLDDDEEWDDDDDDEDDDEDELDDDDEEEDEDDDDEDDDEDTELDE
jgi:hypothetical protein